MPRDQFIDSNQNHDEIVGHRHSLDVNANRNAQPPQQYAERPASASP